LLLVTTSRRPSPRTRSFIKDLVSIIPSASKINRGHKSLVELAIEANRLGYQYILIVSDCGGNPSSIAIYEVAEDTSGHLALKNLAVIKVRGVKLSRENPESSKTYGASSLSINYSNCVSSDCFYIADLLTKIFEKILSEKPDIIVHLSESKYIELKFTNIHGKPVGPVLRIIRVEKRQ